MIPPWMNEISRGRVNTLYVKFSGGEGGYFSISRGQERACKNFQGVFDEKIFLGGGQSKEKLVFQRVFSCSPHFLGGKHTFSLCFQGYFLHTKVSWGWVVKFYFPGGKPEPSLIHGGVTNINWNSQFGLYSLTSGCWD